MGNAAVFVFVASSLADILEKEISRVDMILFEVATYRFCDWRFRHQRRLEVEYSFGVLYHKCTAIARITFDGHWAV